MLIIDWPQYVERDYPSAKRLLERDVKNIVQFFKRKFKTAKTPEEALIYVKS
jgi:RIO kinase 2